jgi:membrane carboxypeptidase/penicillin-binding protein
MRKRSLIKILSILVGIIIIYYSVTILIARHNNPQIVGDILQSDAIKLRLSYLSERQLHILLTVEDPDFYCHKGVDLSTSGAGITTITQGLVKKLYFRQFKPGIRKIKQTLIARFALDPLVSKENQLLMLINIFDFCYGTKGFGEASEYYFGKFFSELTEDEYIALVAMFAGCSSYNPIHNAEANAERVARIKRVLAGEYVPRKMKDIYYSDDKDAFMIKLKQPI